MHRLITGTVVSLLLSLPAQAAEPITAEQIQYVIDATDVAAMNRDTTGIDAHLGSEFKRILEFQYRKWIARVTVRRDQYLEMIAEGWADPVTYYYQREGTMIQVMPDGQSGKSRSTITENFTQDGKTVTSRFREYATYELENGLPVITEVSGHTLVGDTTPQWQEPSD